MSFHDAHGATYHDESPNLPRKPNEYQRMQSGGSINDLLKSLNIDDDYTPQVAYNRQLEASSTSERRQTYMKPHGPSIPPIPAAQNYLPSSHMSEEYHTSNQATYQATRHNAEAPRFQNDSDPEGLHTASTGTQNVPQPNSNKERPTRKPVDSSPEARSYFSPDDLDELVKDHPRYRGEMYTKQVPYGMTPNVADRSAAQVSSSYEVHGRSASVRPGRQLPPTGQELISHRASLPMPELMTNPQSYGSPISVYESGNQQSNGMSHEDHFRHRSTSPYHPLQQNTSTARLPSPPGRRETLPHPTSAYHSPQYQAAVLGHEDLAPPIHTHMPSPQIYPKPLPRQDSMPSRSMSALSNYSQTSNDRDMLHRYPTVEPAVYNGGRLASPDRYHQQIRPTLQDDNDRSLTASVPPTAQSRRGRQKGEIVTESDLPAMPPLFVEKTGSKDFPNSPTPVPAFPPSVSPSRSPTRNSMVLPNRSPRKRQSFAREPDKLQSIKCLPVRPMRCPPLCLEERYHPFAFVKTNKFKVKVYPYQEPFVAGGEIFGHIDVVSDEGFRAQLGSTQVSVGEIGVEVIGYEEIQHPETGHNPRSFTFLFSRKVFQLPAETHPERAMEEHILTSAVLHNPPPDKDGYRSASKGTTSFPFSFHLPVDAPSSADLHTARVKYLVTGYATVKLQGSHEVIATSVPVRVVEAWDVDNPVYEQPIEAAYGRDIANYHEIAATAKIARSLYVEGQTVSGIIRIANHSSKKIREVKFQLMNKITFFGDKRPPVYDLNPLEDLSIETSVHGHSEPHILVNGEEETWKFNLSIPENRCVSVRNTALFEVTPFILIKISTGPLQKSTRLEMPAVSIANPESLVDHHKRLAPTSDVMKWSNLPFLYRYQVVNRGEPGPAQKGTFEVLDLITYFGAQERVMLLSTG